MKKKIFGGIAILTIAVLAAFNVNLDNENNDLSLLSLANVEALASETTISHNLSCKNAGVKMCKATCGIHQVTMENYGDGKVGTFTCTTTTS